MIAEGILNSAESIIECSSIISIERVGGMTNKNYKIVHTQDDEKLESILRIPGDSIGSMIDRSEECQNIRALETALIEGLDCVVLPDYIDESGLKLTSYIEHSKMDVLDDNKLTLALETLGALHDSNIEFVSSRTCFELARSYKEKLTQLLEDYQSEEVHCKLSRLDKLIPTDKLVELEKEYSSIFNDDYKPCHIDTVPDNFFICKDIALLNDYEYACMSDKYWDIVNLMSESGVTDLKDILVAVRKYNGAYVLDSDTIRRLNILNIMNSYCWYLWSLIDEILNEECDTTYGDTKLKDLCAKLLQEGI